MVSQERQSIGGRYKKGSEKHLYDMKPKQGTERNFRQSENGGFRAERKRDGKATLERQRCQKTRKNFGYEKREDAKK